MRKLIALLTVFIIFSTVSASAGSKITPAIRADKIFIPIGHSGQIISLKELAQIKVKDLEMLTGNKMRFFERMAFKTAQKKIRKNIAHDGTISNNGLENYLGIAGKQIDEKPGFDFGGFVWGFFLGPFGVLLAYILNDDHSKNRRKWAWIGCGVWAVFVILLLL